MVKEVGKQGKERGPWESGKGKEREPREGGKGKEREHREGRESPHRSLCGLYPHVLNVLGMQMRSSLHMQSSHVPKPHG